MPMHIHAEYGGFHAKDARVALDQNYVAVKVNGNFPTNEQRSGLPTIQGIIVLCDATNRCVLAVMDSLEITLRRIAAATALAARFLACEEQCVAVCGCGARWFFVLNNVRRGFSGGIIVKRVTTVGP